MQPIMRYTALLLSVLLLSLAACGDDKKDEEKQRYTPPSANNDSNNAGDPNDAWILVDQIHTTKQNPELKLIRDNYSYQGMHGYHDLFQHLKKNGYPFRYIDYTPENDERLTPEILKDFKVLFINLVSADRPDFTAEEISAIHEWVEGGGGLFVIADHTNVYYHAERINPILKPMGIEVLYHTALDKPPEYGIQGGAWIIVRNFTDHPINEGVDAISFETGGPLKSEFATATLSDDGWGDFWIETPDKPGFYGNWRLDEDEPTGKLPVVAAAEYGEGRVAVVGDQNIFGDEWLFMVQNFEAATNIFEWLAKNEGANPPLRDKINYDENYVVGIDLEKSDWNIGINACTGFFPFFINFNRTDGIIARGGSRFDNKEHALVFTDPSGDFTEDLTKIRQYFQDGKTVVVLSDVVTGRSGARQLIKHFVPDMNYTINGADTSIDQLPVSYESATVELEVGQSAPISSPVLEIEGMKMAGHRYKAGQQCPEDIEESTPYLRNVTSSTGEPFLQATLPNGDTVDLARIVDVDNGKMIVFLQDGFWHNETLGEERTQPTPAVADAHQIQYKFLDWLMTQR